MLHSPFRSLSWLTAPAVLLWPCLAFGQNPTASGTINAFVVNQSGLAIVFDNASGGVPLGASGTSAASLNFGSVSAFGAVPTGVTRSPVSGGSYTLSTAFNIYVVVGGLTSTSYTLRGQLTAAAPTGLTYGVDSVGLATTQATISTNGTYNTDVQHTLNLSISTASPGAGGPSVGAPLTATINFTAVSN
jgi:hypothetical protein